MEEVCPHSAETLVAYLKRYPVIDARFSNHSAVYVFKAYSGHRIVFNYADKMQDTLSFCLTDGSVQYHDKGFDRHLPPLVAHYYYRGSRDWKKSLTSGVPTVKTERTHQIELWDEIFKNLRLE